MNDYTLQQQIDKLGWDENWEEAMGDLVYLIESQSLAWPNLVQQADWDTFYEMGYWSETVCVNVMKWAQQTSLHIPPKPCSSEVPNL